jgi:hypothetical protein
MFTTQLLMKHMKRVYCVVISYRFADPDGHWPLVVTMESSFQPFKNIQFEKLSPFSLIRGAHGQIGVTMGRTGIDM